MKLIVRLGALLLVVLMLASCGSQGPGTVSTANPHASRAALTMLERGGSAVDAAIAAQLVLTLTEPQSSGIGGGLFLMHWDVHERELAAIDGRETAPRAATERLFLRPDGTPLTWHEASIGGRPVGVPGVIAALWMAHQAHGRLNWEDLFEPAIRLATDGFKVSPRLHDSIKAAPRLFENAAARVLYYLPGDTPQPVPAGHLLKNPNYAQTLRLIAERGPDGFYKGETAQAIVDAVTGHKGNPGAITIADLAAYEAKRREPVCLAYRSYKVCGMPPPTSGGLTSLMILGMLEPFDMPRFQPNSLTAVHLYTQAARLAYADRAAYMADPDFIDVPVAGLLDKGYLRKRSLLINPGHDSGHARPGLPAGAQPDYQRAADAGLKNHGTSHLAVIDRWGNAVSLTMSVEQRFGAHIMAGGFILNNQLTDFSWLPEKDGVAVANRVEPGKRPRSSMSPTLVFNEDGTLFAAVGSPGGSRIIKFVTQTLIALVDWQLPMQEAIDLPRAVNRNAVTELEAGTNLSRLAAPLLRMGHEVRQHRLTSGLHGIRITSQGHDGGADPRREGVVMTTGR